MFHDNEKWKVQHKFNNILLNKIETHIDLFQDLSKVLLEHADFQKGVIYAFIALKHALNKTPNFDKEVFEAFANSTRAGPPENCDNLQQFMRPIEALLDKPDKSSKAS